MSPFTCETGTVLLLTKVVVSHTGLAGLAWGPYRLKVMSPPALGLALLSVAVSLTVVGGVAEACVAIFGKKKFVHACEKSAPAFCSRSLSLLRDAPPAVTSLALPGTPTPPLAEGVLPLWTS